MRSIFNQRLGKADSLLYLSDAVETVVVTRFRFRDHYAWQQLHTFKGVATLPWGIYYAIYLPRSLGVARNEA